MGECDSYRETMRLRPPRDGLASLCKAVSRLKTSVGVVDGLLAPRGRAGTAAPRNSPLRQEAVDIDGIVD